MRRDYFTLEIGTDPGATDGVDRPTMAIDYDGPAEALESRLTDEDGTVYDAAEVDVAFRRQPDGERGVIAITDRLTGEFVLEVGADADDVRDLVTAARENEGGDCSYRVRIERPEADSVVLDKRTLLVYDQSGNLKRDHSLIPSGVEL